MMNSRKPLLAALAGAALITGVSFTVRAPTAAAAQQAQAPTPKKLLTRKFAIPLNKAEKAEKKGQFRQALAELDKARALSKPTPWETHLINELSIYAYYKTNNLTAMANAMEATLGDGFLPPAQAKSRVQQLALTYYQMKNYPKAAEYGRRAIESGASDPSMVTIVSQAYYLEGNLRESAKFTEGIVTQEIKQGKTPVENQMQIVLNACVQLKDSDCIDRILGQLVMFYPRPAYWQDIMLSLFNSRTAESSDTDMLNIYRLAEEVGALSMPSQYIEMAQLSLEKGLPGDAERVLESGYGKNVFTAVDVRQRASRLLATAKKQAASDQRSLPKLASQAASAAKGEEQVALGMDYLGYQQYDQAATALSQGLAKGGVKDPAQARLLLGIAQLKSGHRAQAIATFKQVSGNPILVRLAKLWTLRAKGKASAAVQSS